MKREWLILILGGLMLTGPSAFAKPAFLKRAKELNLPDIDSCQACHISTELGNAKWNERGLWLKAKKQELGADEVDVAWLKDYKPAN
jgi:hypothetical protein